MLSSLRLAILMLSSLRLAILMLSSLRLAILMLSNLRLAILMLSSLMLSVLVSLVCQDSSSQSPPANHSQAVESCKDWQVARRARFPPGAEPAKSCANPDPLPPILHLHQPYASQPPSAPSLSQSSVPLLAAAPRVRRRTMAPSHSSHSGGSGGASKLAQLKTPPLSKFFQFTGRSSAAHAGKRNWLEAQSSFSLRPSATPCSKQRISANPRNLNCRQEQVRERGRSSRRVAECRRLARIDRRRRAAARRHRHPLRLERLPWQRRGARRQRHTVADQPGRCERALQVELDIGARCQGEAPSSRARKRP